MENNLKQNVRKNGINRELTPIAGGVCAPSGFYANGIYCGIAEKCGSTLPYSRENAALPNGTSNREDLSLIAAKKRCSVACMYADNSANANGIGAPARVTKKNLQSGLARAMIVNSGVANVSMLNGERLAKRICVRLAKEIQCLDEDVAIASTGEIGELAYEPIADKISDLVAGLGNTDAHSFVAARGLMTTDKTAKQLSFSFELGDYTCKIGAIMKGGKRVCPQMATTICLLTTDVAIAPQTLQKALRQASNATLNLLNKDGVASPNDFICIMASGEAGNYIISNEDSEYQKFCFILTEVLKRVCRMLVADGEGTVAECLVSGAKSAKSARDVAKAVAKAEAVRSALRLHTVDVQSLVNCIYTAGYAFRLDKLEISLLGGEEKFVLYSQGRRQYLLPETAEKIFQNQTVTLCLGLGEGNYSACSTFCFDEE